MARHLGRAHEDLVDDNSAGQSGGRSILSLIPNVKKKKSNLDLKTEQMEAVATLLVECNLPLNLVEKDAFRNMICTFQPSAHLVCHFTYRTIRREVETMGELSSKAMLMDLKGKCFALTTDHWISLSRDKYKAVTEHYIDGTQLRSLILHMSDHHGKTDGERQGSDLAKLLSDLDFEFKFTTGIVTDTCGKMGTFRRFVLEKGLRHLYCFSHNVQLTAKLAFTDTNLPGSEDTMKAARVRVGHFSSSTQALDLLKRQQEILRPGEQPLAVVQDVTTRWWSTYKMVKRLNLLMPCIDSLFAGGQVSASGESRQLTEMQKKILVQAEKVLEPIAVFQEMLEGEKFVTLSLVPFGVYTICLELQKFAASNQLGEPVKHLASVLLNDFVRKRYGDGSWVFHEEVVVGRLNRYVSLHPIAIVVAALDPQFKTLSPYVPKDDHTRVWDYVLKLMLDVASS